MRYYFSNIWCSNVGHGLKFCHDKNKDREKGAQNLKLKSYDPKLFKYFADI